MRHAHRESGGFRRRSPRRVAPLKAAFPREKRRIRRFGAMGAPSAPRMITWGAAGSPQTPRLRALLWGVAVLLHIAPGAGVAKRAQPCAKRPTPFPAKKRMGKTGAKRQAAVLGSAWGWRMRRPGAWALPGSCPYWASPNQRQSRRPRALPKPATQKLPRSGRIRGNFRFPRQLRKRPAVTCVQGSALARKFASLPCGLPIPRQPVGFASILAGWPRICAPDGNFSRPGGKIGCPARHFWTESVQILQIVENHSVPR